MDKIVSVEVQQDDVVIYYSNGSSSTQPLKLWITSRVYDNSFVKLEGELTYKYGKAFDNTPSFFNAKKSINREHIYTVNDLKTNYLIRSGFKYYLDMEMSDLKVLGFDIETSGLLHESNKKVYIIANTFKIGNKKIRKLFSIDDFQSESDMLLSWCEWVRNMDPDVLVNHNIFGFDLPYLLEIADKNNIKLRLGRDNSPLKIKNFVSKYRVDGTQVWEYKNIECHGREIIDTMFLSVKYDIGRNFPSWGLKKILSHLESEYQGLSSPNSLQQEILDSQSKRQHYDASLISKNWDNIVEREKIKKYAENDGDDAIFLFELMAPSFFYLCQTVPMSFQTLLLKASGSWVNAILLSEYLKNAHSIPAPDAERLDVAGGMSYGCPGIYTNVTKWDAASYYPSTMLTFSIGPGKEKDPKDKFLKFLKMFKDKRFEYKKLYKETKNQKYDDLQASFKVLINSAYGALGTNGLHFNNFRNADLITKCCRKGLQKAIIWATGRNILAWWPEYKETKTYEHDFGDFTFIDEKSEIKTKDMERHDWKLVNIDTDSLSFAKKDGSAYTQEELDHIYKYINKIMYSEWEDDGYYEGVVILKAKNYALKQGNKVKLKGSSITDSKKEKELQTLLKNCIYSMLEGKDCSIKHYENSVDNLINNFDIQNWVTKKSVTKAVLENERTNEKVIREAFNGRTFSEGDKIFIYYNQEGKPQLLEDYDKNESKSHYLKRLYDTMKILQNVTDLEKIEKYYTKKKMKEMRWI